MKVIFHCHRLSERPDFLDGVVENDAVIGEPVAL